MSVTSKFVFLSFSYVLRIRFLANDVLTLLDIDQVTFHYFYDQVSQWFVVQKMSVFTASSSYCQPPSDTLLYSYIHFCFAVGQAHCFAYAKRMYSIKKDYKQSRTETHEGMKRVKMNILLYRTGRPLNKINRSIPLTVLCIVSS